MAAGPFTTKSDLSFEPLEELLAAAAALQGGPPAALLLAGPFLDAGHPVVAGSQLDIPLQHVFEQEVSWRLMLNSSQPHVHISAAVICNQHALQEPSQQHLKMRKGCQSRLCFQQR